MVAGFVAVTLAFGPLPARVVVPAGRGEHVPDPYQARQLQAPAAARPALPRGDDGDDSCPGLSLGVPRAGSGRRRGARMSGVWLASYIVLWVVVLVLAFLLAGALRQLGLMQLRLGDDPGVLITDTGLERGAKAPDFTAIESESGELVTLSEMIAKPKGARLRLTRLPLVPRADPGFERSAQDAQGRIRLPRRLPRRRRVVPGLRPHEPTRGADGRRHERSDREGFPGDADPVRVPARPRGERRHPRHRKRLAPARVAARAGGHPADLRRRGARSTGTEMPTAVAEPGRADGHLDQDRGVIRTALVPSPVLQVHRSGLAGSRASS